MAMAVIAATNTFVFIISCFGVLIWLPVIALKEPEIKGIRLSYGSSHEGRIEIFRDGQWGTLCRNGFTRADGNVVCRSLGFGPPITLNYGYFSSSLPVMTDNLNCTGDENWIDDCPTNWNKSPVCDSDTRASIKCEDGQGNFHALRLYNRDSDLISAISGAVQIRYDEEWRFICYDDWDITKADIVCRQLGYASADSADAYTYSSYKPLGNFSCIGNETRLDMCKDWTLTDCQDSLKATVTCKAPKNTNEIPVRLVNGSVPNEGRVEILDSGKWSTVCDVAWDITDAGVVCKQLGYAGANETRSGGYFGAGTGPILLSNVKCGYSYPLPLDVRFCESTYHPACLHSNDAGVKCNYGEPRRGLRLDDVSSAYEGTVRIQFNLGSGPMQHTHWQMICSTNWGTKEANVVCRELGYLSGEATVKVDYPEQDSLSDFLCKGNETRLYMCKARGTWYKKKCDHFAGVRCNASKDALPVRLVNGATEHEGRVEIFHAGEWSTICDRQEYRSWGRHEADTVCRQLGYKQALKAKAYYGPGTGTILLSAVSCLHKPLDIRFCDSDWYPGPYCSHSNDVGVVCDNGGISTKTIAGTVVSSIIFIVMIVTTILLILRCKPINGTDTNTPTGPDGERQEQPPVSVAHIQHHTPTLSSPQLTFSHDGVVYPSQNSSNAAVPQRDDGKLSDDQHLGRPSADGDRNDLDAMTFPESDNVDIDDRQNLLI